MFLHILIQHLKPSQTIVLISRYWSEGGDYLQQREALFANATLDDLTQAIQIYEQQRS